MGHTLTMSKLSCSECGKDAVERNGAVMRCDCGSRKFSVDAEDTEIALRLRIVRLEAMLRGVMQAAGPGPHCWTLTRKLHEAGLLLEGREA